MGYGNLDSPPVITRRMRWLNVCFVTCYEINTHSHVCVHILLSWLLVTKDPNSMLTIIVLMLNHFYKYANITNVSVFLICIAIFVAMMAFWRVRLVGRTDVILFCKCNGRCKNLLCLNCINTWRMLSSGMLCHVALIRTDILEECLRHQGDNDWRARIILAVNSNCSTPFISLWWRMYYVCIIIGPIFWRCTHFLNEWFPCTSHTWHSYNM
jgi:hypothetical protein